MAREDDDQVPAGGRFAKSDPDIYRRAREAVMRRQIDEQFGEKPARPAARRAAPRVTDTGDETARLRRREMAEPTASPAEMERMREMERSQALERVTPEAMMVPPLRPLMGAARAAGAARAMAPAAAPPARATTTPRIMPKGTNPVKQRAERAERAKSEREGKSSMEAEGGSPTRAPAPPPRREPPRDLDEMRMSGEGPGFRKGGMVGGASKRADGIAQRGKTKGRYI